MSIVSRLAAAIPIFALTLFGSVVVTQADSVDVTSRYVVLAWPGLDKHCPNPAYDQAEALPPHNDLVAQVVLRGNPPKVVTTGLIVEYSILNDTSSSGKGNYGQLWNYAQKLFGGILSIEKGLEQVAPKEHNALAGRMVAKGTDFVADGIPVTPLDDAGIWNAYRVAVITVKNRKGTVLARTSTTIPASDGINCGKCHGVEPFKDILVRHDRMHGTTLASQPPMLCSGCHADSALKTAAAGSVLSYRTKSRPVS